MKIAIVTGFFAVLPAMAQSPDELVDRLRQTLQTFQVRVNGQQPVKNAPFSADAITETTQVLADGNRIVQRTTQRLYRDSDGRERREESVLAVGALAQADAPRIIIISDPSANVSWNLTPATHIARKTPFLAEALRSAPLTVNFFNGRLGVFRTAGGSPEIERATHMTPENLGDRMIEGVSAHGTRSTSTIPAGQIGNTLPIKIVDEVWYSPDLQMNVMTTHSDPRSGDVVYRLTNISRANPSPTLFQVPPEYTVQDVAAGGGRGGRGAGQR